MRRLITSSQAKACGYLLFSLSLLLLFAGNLLAYDTPHSTVWTKNPSKKVGCSTTCHVPKAAQAEGPCLTTQAKNYDLCMICHISGPTSRAGNLPFDNNDQADQTKGTSHRWDKYLPASNNFNNPYGLRSAGSLQNAPLKFVAGLYKDADGRGGVTCSTCHMHYQTTNPWDPAGGLYKSPGATATAGDKKTIIQTGAGWTENRWGGCSDTNPIYQTKAACEGAGKTWIDNFYVRIISGSSKGYVRLIKSNTSNTLQIYATLLSTDPDAKRLTFPVVIASGTTYVIMSAENHFMRVENKASEMCEDCHYYRTPDSKPGGSIPQTNVETCNPNAVDGGRCYKMSHPIRKNLTTDVSNANQFVGAAPLEPLSVFDANGDIRVQTNQPRYYENAGTCSNPAYTTKFTCETNSGTWTPADDNLTNNIVLDSNSKVRCMSCHGMHYTDSDSSTIDGP